MKKIILLLCVAALALGAFFLVSKKKADTKPISDAMEQATYVFEEDQPVTLKSGSAVGPLSPRFQNELYTTKILSDRFFADLDGDGDLDGVAYFTRDQGDQPGYYLAAVVNNGGTYTGTNAVFLGSLIDPGSFTIQDKLLQANYIGHFPDPNTMPQSLPNTKYFSLVGSKLVDATDEYRAAHQPPPITDKDEAPVRVRATAVLTALKQKDLKAFTALVHPTLGLRFGYDGSVTNIKMTRAELEKHAAAGDKIAWGIADGRGEDIVDTLKERLATYYRYDYLTAPKISYKKVLRGGTNSLSNIDEIFPGKPYLNYFFPYTSSYTGDNGEPVNSEMSWAGLTLVFDNYQGQWYLVSIVSDNWTI